MRDTPIVLLHGAGCNLEDMRLALGEHLAIRHRVILVDRAGLGWSERKGRRGSSPAYQAAILRDVLDQLGSRARDRGRPFLGWGARGEFRARSPQARRRPGVAGAAALSASTQHDLALCAVRHARCRMALCAHAGAAVRLAVHRRRPGLGIPAATAAARLYQAHRRAAAAAAGDISRQCARRCRPQRFPALQASRYAKLAAPTVIITGDRDMVVPPRQHAFVFAAAVPRQNSSCCRASAICCITWRRSG